MNMTNKRHVKNERGNENTRKTNASVPSFSNLELRHLFYTHFVPNKCYAKAKKEDLRVNDDDLLFYA